MRMRSRGASWSQRRLRWLSCTTAKMRTLRGDLLKTVKALSEEKTFDYLVIESTGISEPLPVAQTFVMDVDNDTDEGKQQKLQVAETAPQSLSHYAQLDTMVSVVDALNIFDVSPSKRRRRTLQAGGVTAWPCSAAASNPVAAGSSLVEDDQRRTAHRPDWFARHRHQQGFILLVRTVKLRIKACCTVTQKLHPARSNHVRDLEVEKELLNTGLFDMEEASMSAGWMQELEKEEHAPETEEYGISSTVFRCSSMPFHPGRLNEILTGFGTYGSALESSKQMLANASEAGGSSGAGDSSRAENTASKVFQGVVRSKGHVWLANAHAFPLSIHTSGKHLTMVPAPIPFLAAIDEDKWDEDERKHHEALVEQGNWNKQFGDRSSEIVFIGVNLNKALIHEKLNGALLTEAESKALGGVQGWKTLEDAFFEARAEYWFEVQYNEG